MLFVIFNWVIPNCIDYLFPDIRPCYPDHSVILSPTNDLVVLALRQCFLLYTIMFVKYNKMFPAIPLFSLVITALLSLLHDPVLSAIRRCCPYCTTNFYCIMTMFPLYYNVFLQHDNVPLRRPCLFLLYDPVVSSARLYFSCFATMFPQYDNVFVVRPWWSCYITIMSPQYSCYPNHSTKV